MSDDDDLKFLDWLTLKRLVIMATLAWALIIWVVVTLVSG